MSAETIRLSRQELYDLVWSEPVSRLADRYNLSDVGLRKICTKHRIPVPIRGHWQKLAAGKKVRPIPLPMQRDEAEIVIHVAAKAAIETEEPDIFRPAIDAEDASPPVVAGERLTGPHPAIEAARRALAHKPDRYGVVHSSMREAPLIRVAPASVSRALRIVDALLKACAARGFELKAGREGAPSNGQLKVMVDGFGFGLNVSERTRREPYQLTAAELERRRRGQFVYAPTYQYVATGELSIKLEPAWGSRVQNSWADSKKQRIEERLGEIMLSLRKLAIHRRIEAERERARQVRLEEERQRRAKLRAEVEAEKKRVERLERDADAWRRAETLRAYAAARGAQGDPATDPDLARWLAWASDQADRVDPLRASPPSIIDTPDAEMEPLSIWNMPHP